MNEFEGKVQAFLNRHPGRFTRQLDPNDLSFYIYTMAPNPAPPNTFGPVLGDVVHNLRSSLDHIAWNLALLNLEEATQEPYPFTAFPIIVEDGLSGTTKFDRLTQDVLPDAIPIIRDLQPYHRGNDANLHELAILDALWNSDKHRVNTSIAGREFVPMYDGPGGGVKILDDGTRLFRVPVRSNPEEHLEPHITTEVLFQIPKTRERVSLAFLDKMLEFVRSDVIPRFSRFLPESTGLVEREAGTRKR